VTELYRGPGEKATTKQAPIRAILGAALETAVKSDEPPHPTEHVCPPSVLAVLGRSFTARCGQ
jgi:hypothetical protein